MSGSGPGTRPSATPPTSPRPGRCAASGSPPCARPAEPEVQIRALADYDAALGTGGGVA